MTIRTLTKGSSSQDLRFPSSLKLRILLFTGSVLVFLLLIISQVLLFQWREAIIAKQCESTLAVSRTFSVTVIDALIREEQALAGQEGVLQIYVENFKNSLGNVKYVAVLDNVGRPVAATPPLASRVAARYHTDRIERPVTEIDIRDDDTFSWVVQVHLPLRIGNKSWGTAIIGFDATGIRAEIRNLFFLLFVITMAVTCLTLLVLYSLASRLTSSLHSLVQQIDKVAHNTTIASIPGRANDEVEFLFDRFDVMKKRIDQSHLQLEEAQRQIYQAEKLASIGRLASGVAHQVNNPLNGIRSCLYAIDKEPENTAQTKEYVALIGEAIANIEAVVKKLLGFARQQAVLNSPIDIAATTRKVADLFDVRLREKRIHVHLHLSEGLPPANIDEQLFQEVVMNLLLNSYDAVEQEGNITISAGLKDPATVFLTVKDDGAGIREEDLAHIFEPFYTTKEIGKGTGLGLSVSHSIIENHGGQLRVNSVAGQGAEFTVTLPVSRTQS